MVLMWRGILSSSIVLRHDEKWTAMEIIEFPFTHDWTFIWQIPCEVSACPTGYTREILDGMFTVRLFTSLLQAAPMDEEDNLPLPFHIMLAHLKDPITTQTLIDQC